LNAAIYVLLKNAGLAHADLYFGLFVAAIVVAALSAWLALGMQERTRPVERGARVGVDNPRTRFGAVFAASVAAITFMVPLEYHGNGHPWEVNNVVLPSSLIPALIAWLVIRKRPAREGPALLRGVALTFALVGAGGFGLLPFADLTGGWTREMVESVRFPIQAKIYLAVGFVGVIASFLFGRDNVEQT
jgi:hypothetical protein